MSYSHDLRFAAFASVTLAIVLSTEVYAQQPWSARPEVVTKFESRPGPFNYDEQKVPVYTLPDPLVASDGSEIATADDWNQTRRGELIELFRSRLPVDQHEVMGLIAPRGVYVASADEDLWADPRGEYASLVAAAPVFRLLNEKSISNATMPALNQPRVSGQTGYHIRTGGHGLGDTDWKWFLDFADRLLKP